MHIINFNNIYSKVLTKRSGQRYPPIIPDITPPPTFTPGTVISCAN